MILLKQKMKNGRMHCRVKINAKGKAQLIVEAAGAISAICTSAQKNEPDITFEMLMELARKLMENGSVKEEE